MSNSIEVTVPDLGGATEVEVIELLVSVGDHVKIEDPLVSLETDKATVEIPSPRGGAVLELRVAEGDVVEIGTTILVFGEAAAYLEEVLRGRVETKRVATLSEAVKAAAERAKPGDVVLLAPACASFDQFRNFEERGSHFRSAVMALQSETRVQ